MLCPNAVSYTHLDVYKRQDIKDTKSLFLLAHSRGEVKYAKPWDFSDDFISFDEKSFPEVELIDVTTRALLNIGFTGFTVNINTSRAALAFRLSFCR